MENRNEIIMIRVSQSDKERIHEKMEELGIRNMSAYIRKMALDGYCVNLDLADVKELVYLLRQCSNNLNQYAKKANQTGSIYEEDLQDLQSRFDEFWKIGKELLARLSTIQ
ncbi:MAG: plasmid mobilization relaxosome protein MobC [Eubacteriales bacterium]|nr:plasmid mobilization relaxosome protein MobC [Eubacteriales bacterium]